VPSPSSERRIPELDGIRGLAILSVIYWHYVAAPGALAEGHSLSGILYRIGMFGWSGVDLFFVLSGFLIGGILLDARSRPRYFQTFYVRRAFRILPLYVVLYAAGAVTLALRPSWEAIVGRPMPFVVYAAFLQNFWLAHHSWDAYMGVTWSLAVEEQFYLFFPLVVRFARTSWLPFLIGGLALMSAAARTVLYLHFGMGWGVAAYTLVFCRADALMLGVLGAWALREPRVRTLLEARPSILRATVLVLGTAVTIMLVKGWTMLTRPMSTVGYSCLALFYLSLILLAVVRPDGWWAALTRLAPLRSMGRVAYCIYLVHGMTYSICTYWFGGTAHPNQFDWRSAAAGLVLSLAIARLSWRYFESKMIRIGHDFSYAPVVSTSPVSSGSA
jgi:peptidoglycan/LPS O-acetylase OafA/YrhL